MIPELLTRFCNFGLLWLAQLVSFIGEGIMQTAMIWWVITKTGSGTTVGFILSVSFLPAVLIGPFAGTLADRLPAKLLLIGADLFRACLVGGVAVMAWHQSLSIPLLLGMCGMLAAAGVFHSPTTLTVIPRVVPAERIDEAMALHTIVRDISKLAGPALGGAIIARWSVAEAFAAHAACLVVSSVCVAIMGMAPRETSGEHESVVSQLSAGLRYVREHRVLRDILIGFGSLNLFAVPIVVLLPLSIKRTFGLDAFELGVSEGVLAFGSVVTGLAFVRLFAAVPTSRLLVRTLGVSGLLFVFFAFNTYFALYLIGLFLLGGCFTAVNVAVLTLFQRTVAPEMKGRFFALVEVLSFALIPIAMAGAGALSDTLHLASVYQICAAGTLLLTWRFARIDGLTTLDAQPEADPVPAAQPASPDHGTGAA
ncbi:MAG TPA: MFS transporter [Candidatus Ozemobacteraceae bacterium]|nr:MFS transporter [Candidatus Ozemobacteraceae bacterium]